MPGTQLRLVLIGQVGLRLVERPRAGGSVPSFRTILFNNAASLGGVQRASSLEPSLREFRAGVDLNVTSGLWTAKRFLQFAAEHAAVKPAVVVNVSSLAAVKPFPSLGNYCVSKAARDMFTAVVAVENPESDVRTIG